MDITIQDIKNRGDIDSERVVFIVTSDCDLGKYIAFKTTSSNNGETVSSDIEYPYWFPDTEVKKGDMIVLYTKEGVKNSKENSDKTTTYFYYLSLSEPIYDDEASIALLMYSGVWTAKKPE